MNPPLKTTHHVVNFSHIDDPRCIRPLAEALEEMDGPDPRFSDPQEFQPVLDALHAEVKELFATHPWWEGGGTFGCIFLAPCFVHDGDTHCQVIYHVKQSNNGMSFLALPNGLELAEVIGDSIQPGTDTKRTKSRKPSKAAGLPSDRSLVGQYFHSVLPDTGKVKWQGKIIGRPEPGLYLLQLFEWLLGGDSTRHLVRVEEMTDWLFYEDAEAMKHSWQYGTARPGSKYHDR